jgi:hypothetical protein
VAFFNQVVDRSAINSSVFIKGSGIGYRFINSLSDISCEGVEHQNTFLLTKGRGIGSSDCLKNLGSKVITFYSFSSKGNRGAIPHDKKF